MLDVRSRAGTENGTARHGVVVAGILGRFYSIRADRRRQAARIKVKIFNNHFCQPLCFVLLYSLLTKYFYSLLPRAQRAKAQKPKRSRRHHLFDNGLREKRFLVVIVPPLVPSEEHDDEDE